MSTTEKKRRYLNIGSSNQSDGDNEDTSIEQTTTAQRRSSDTADCSSIVSERQQMAVIKQLSAGDELYSMSFEGRKNFVYFFCFLNKADSPSSIIQFQRPSKIHRCNEHGETIVHIAARKGDLKQLKKALKSVANINEKDNAGKQKYSMNFLLFLSDGLFCYRMDTIA
jgi:ankyrin repeat protein